MWLPITPTSALAAGVSSTTGTKFLDKRDRKVACTGAADKRGLRGLTRQQFRAACRGRPIPRSVN